MIVPQNGVAPHSPGQLASRGPWCGLLPFGVVHLKAPPFQEMSAKQALGAHHIQNGHGASFHAIEYTAGWNHDFPVAGFG